MIPQTLLVFYMDVFLISYVMITKHGEIKRQSVKYISSAKKYNLIAIHIASYGEYVRVGRKYLLSLGVDCRV